MSTHRRCTLIDGPARGCFVNLSTDQQELALCHSPVEGPQMRWTYKRAGSDQFAFVRAEPFTLEPEKPPIAVAHSEEKLVPEMKDWERRGVTLDPEAHPA